VEEVTIESVRTVPISTLKVSIICNRVSDSTKFWPIVNSLIFVQESKKRAPVTEMKKNNEEILVNEKICLFVLITPVTFIKYLIFAKEA
jgi:hypothetical protein